MADANHPSAADHSRQLLEELQDSDSEAWPDNDVDVDSPKGKRAADRAEDALYHEFERQAAERERQFRGPDKAYEIAKELYDKAEKANDQLTEGERALLLSRGDVVGKALARPDSLTVQERYQVLQWSPPDELHTAIRTATDGALGTPEELYAMARNGNFSHPSPGVKRILASKFWIDPATETTWLRLHWNSTPGNRQATSLLYQRAGIDVTYFTFVSLSEYTPSSAPDPGPNQGPANASVDHASPPPGTQPPNSMPAIASMLPHPSILPKLFPTLLNRPGARPLPQEDSDDENGPPTKRIVTTRDSRDAGSRPSGPAPQGPPTRDTRGWDGQMAWPMHVNAGRFKPFGLFWDDQKARYPGQELGDVWKVDDVAREVRRRFEALGEEDRAAYEARSEALRQEVWDEREEYERRLARGEMVTLPQRLHP